MKISTDYKNTKNFTQATANSQENVNVNVILTPCNDTVIKPSSL